MSQPKKLRDLKTCHDSNLIRGSILKQLFLVSNIPITYKMVFQIFIRGLSKVKWFFIFVMCNGNSHPAFCQHLRQHQGSIIASIFIWPSDWRRFLLRLQKFKWATLFKKQRKSQNLFCLFHSWKTKLWIMVTKSVSWNAGSLNEFHFSKRCLHFPASLPELWKFAKKSARTDITKRSSISGNIVDKFQTTFLLDQLNILDKVFKNRWKCMPELAIKKGIYTEAKDKVKAGMQRRGVSKHFSRLLPWARLGTWSFCFNNCLGCRDKKTRARPRWECHKRPCVKLGCQRTTLIVKDYRNKAASQMETARKNTASSMALGGKENNSTQHL